MALIVRRLRVPDLPLLEQIERARQERLPHRVGWIKGFRKLVDNTLAAEPEGILVAEDDGKVVGFAICRERQLDPITGVKYGQIVSVGLGDAPARTGQRLLRECEAYLKSRQCEMVQLSLPVDEPQAGELYRANGYKVIAWELQRSLK
jgi:ribosomal protein S18 acetylase RimI-like enzyme